MDIRKKIFKWKSIMLDNAPIIYPAFIHKMNARYIYCKGKGVRNLS